MAWSIEFLLPVQTNPPELTVCSYAEPFTDTGSRSNVIAGRPTSAIFECESGTYHCNSLKSFQ